MSTTQRFVTWLRSILAFRKIHLDPATGIRAALCIGGPFLLGSAIGDLRLFMWAALAAMFGTAGEAPNALLRQTARKVLFTFPFAFATFMLGYARDAVSDWVAIAVLAVLSFVAGVVCTWSKYAALAAMQVLMIGSLVTGMKNGDWFHYGISFVCGGLLYLLLYSIQASIQQRSKAYSWIAAPLTKLSRACNERATSVKEPDVSKELTSFVQAFSDASNSDLLSPSYRSVLAQLDEVEVTASSSDNPRYLRKLAAQLNLLAEQTQQGKISGSFDEISDLTKAVSTYIDSGEAGRRIALFPAPRLVIATARKRHYANTVMNSLRLGTAYTVGLILGQVLPFHHLFWVATTVAVVMTLQIGASVSRAIQRLAGTLVGVIVGTLAMVVSTNHYWLSAVIAFLAFFLPWACQTSQISKQFAMTPIILLLGDLIVPGDKAGIFYGDERLLATFVGAIVIIVFGYLIWPSARHPNFTDDFQRVLRTIANYGHSVIEANKEETKSSRSAESIAVATLTPRTSVYEEISVFQQIIQPTLGEPPYTAGIARRWVAAEISATRVCDSITEHALKPGAIQVVEPDLQALAQRRRPEVVKYPTSKVPVKSEIEKDVIDLAQKISEADTDFYS